MALKNYYDILGIDSNADADEIKEAFRDLTAKYSSATNQKDDFSQQMLQSLNEAVGILANPTKRKEYDETRSLVDENIKLASVHSGIAKQDSIRITDTIQKHFEQEKLVNAKQQALLIAKNTKPKGGLTSLKVIFCLLIVASTTYYYHPELFEFVKGTPVSEQRSYEWITNDTTLIYAKPKSKAKVVFGVPAGSGFNGISETTYYIKVSYTEKGGQSKVGFIKKSFLIKNKEGVFASPVYDVGN